MPRPLALHVPALAAGLPVELPAPRAMSAAEANPPAAAAAAVDAALDDFEPFYRAHVRRVHALCLRMCGDRRRAEELTQDVFVRAWERRATFRGASLVATWLHRLAVNVVLAGARADRRRQARVETSAAPETLSAAWVDGRAAAAGERLDLERAIAALPPGARTAFVLHDVEGYTHEEIARLTGVAPATVRSQLHRARRLLMEALDR
jgi:RNA polymerase sigma-70 factor (ECF subfamily)